MTDPRAIVIPFGVPSDGKGLGLGLAALVHAAVQVDGLGVAIAQLHAGAQGSTSPRTPVEAFVPPAAWQEIAGRGDAPSSADVVITGSFDPPLSGPGMIQILAFDARSGRTRARVDAPVDDDRAGAALLGAIEKLGSHLGGRIGGVEGLGDLRWEPLESVLRAERCVLHDPQRGGPHDRLAAMAHLGRAIGDAPEALYPIARLASIALETATGPAPLDPKLLSAAVRALERASDDAPPNVGLMEALGALHLRSGKAREAERVASEAIALVPDRALPYALLSQSLRAQGDLDGALSVLMAGPTASREDPSFVVERGMVYTERGDFGAASAEWRRALSHDPVHPVAFCALGDVALRLNDSVVAQSLVDAALAATRVHVDVLRRAVHLALTTEANGIARASRVARLCARLVEAVPTDGAALLAWAQALVALGEVPEARARLTQIERLAPSSAASAEAQMVRLAIDDPRTEAEVKSVLRASYTAAPSALADVAARARKLGTMHGAWPAWMAAGIAERQRGRWSAARDAITIALELAPGATPAHLEMVGLFVALGEPERAVSHAERAIALEGASPRALKILARALVAAGRKAAGLDAASRALAIQPGDEDLRALVSELRRSEDDPPLGAKIRSILPRLAWWRR